MTGRWAAVAAALVAVLLGTTGCVVVGEDRDAPAATAGAEARTAPPQLDAPPRQDQTLFGASFQRRRGEPYPEALARTEQTIGLDLVRIFYPGLPDAWPGKAPGRDLVVSFKIDPQEVLSGVHDEQMTEWFRSAPTDQRTYWVYWHEPENDSEAGLFEPEDFRLAYAHIAALAESADNPELRATVVLMSYSLNPQSGRNWRDWFPPADSVDVLAWDVYNRGRGATFYADPAELLGPLREASASVGKPYAIGELGSPLAPGDSGQERARWITAVGCHLVETDARFVAWFDFLWNDGENDYRLVDDFSQQAWRGLAGLSAGDARCEDA